MAAELEARGTANQDDSLTNQITRTDLLAGTAFLMSGVLALIYQFCWIRLATHVFGATTQAVSTVIAVFFAGLAIGSWTFGRISRTTPRPLRLYGMLEVLIGLWALATPLMLAQMQSVLAGVYDSVLTQPLSLLLVRFAMITIVILPPTLLMGGSLPLFVRHYVRTSGTIAKPIGGLYALNTLGAALGCLVCGLYMLPTLGDQNSIYLAAAINVGLGLVVYFLPMSARPLAQLEEEEEQADEQHKEELESPESEPEAAAAPLDQDADGQAVVEQQDRPAKISKDDSSEVEDFEDVEDGQEDEDEEDDWTFEVNERKVVTWMFFFAGFTALGYEVLWTRFLTLVTQQTVLTVTFVLTTVLLGMAAGTLVTSRRLDRSKRRPLQFALVHAGIALSILMIMLLPTPIWLRLKDPQSVGGQLLIVLFLLGLPSLLIGMAFPIAIRLVVDRISSASSEVGRLVAVNTLGGIAGSLLVGFVLLPQIEMQHTLKFLTVVNLLIAIAALMLLEDVMSQTKRGLLALTLALIWIAVPWFAQRFMGTRLPETYIVGRPLMANELVVEGTTASLAVLSDGPGQMHLEIDRMWQGLTTRNHQLVAAHVPALLHPAPQDVLVVGLGAGQTTKAFLSHPSVKKLDCVEIESKLITIVRTGRYFGDSRWMEGTGSQAVNVFAEDGRNYVTLTKNKYDIISLEIGQVFRPSLSGFYTLEFYQSARQRLNEGGLICQFVPTDFLTAENFQRIVATFREAFPQCLLWYNTSELLLIGTNGDSFQLSQRQLKQLTENKVIKRDLSQTYWGGPRQYLNREEVFLGGFIMGSEGISNISVDVVLLRDAIPSLEYIRPPDEGDFGQPIYQLLRDNAQSVLEVLSFTPTPLVAAKASEIQIMNLRHMVAVKYWQKGQRLLTDGKQLIAAGKMQEAGAILAESIGYLQQAKGQLAGFADVYHSLGEAYGAQQNVIVAIDMFRTGLEFNPENAESHNLLAFLMQRQGNVKSAIDHFRQALKLEPMHLQSLNGLARILAMRPERNPAQAKEAVMVAEQAVKLRPVPQVLDTLGMAYAAAGEFEKAIEAVDGAIKMAAQMGAPSEALEPFRVRMAMYKSEKPYIEKVPLMAQPGQPMPRPMLTPGGQGPQQTPGRNLGPGSLRPGMGPGNPGQGNRITPINPNQQRPVFPLQKLPRKENGTSNTKKSP